MSITGPQTMQSMVVTGAPQYSQYGGQYAAPATYAAGVPTMQSMYATPATSMYMPTTTMAAPMAYETMAAPQYAAQPTYTTYAAPAVTQTPSYVAPPVLAAPVVAEVAAPAFAMPQPVSLTAGLPTPDKLNAEKAAYEKALDAQLKKQVDAVTQEAAIKKQMLEATANQQKAQFQLQTEEQLKMAQLQVDQQANQQVMGLREAAITQRTSREEQAAVQAADYLKKKALEDMAAQSYACQKKYFEAEQQMMTQYQAVMQAGSKNFVQAAMPAYAGATI